MASVSASSVTIDRGYFETLVRRSQYSSGNVENAKPAGSHPLVSIPEGEYERLCTISRQYENLKRNLVRGGVVKETVEFLSQDDATIGAEKPAGVAPTETDTNDDGGARLTTPAPTTGYFDGGRHGSNGNGAGYGNKFGSYKQYDAAWGDADADGDDASFSMETPADVGSGHPYQDSQSQRPRFDRQCTRTVQLMNLPDGTTHGDITAVVRGGILLDIFLRTHDRSATVSFLNAADARAFYDHIRRHDLYIRSKRVEVRWNERQFILPGHVAGKIGIGASRNLIIRRCGSQHTEEAIRDDLEHIHNLVVISVNFASGDCYIKTNSVHNAMFARTCMMSRQKYKGSKIEWDVDECAQPYPPPQMLLNMDDGEDDDEISAAFQSKKQVGIAA